MQVLIVVESLFGNTRRVADAIAEGIDGIAGVSVVDAAAANRSLQQPVDLLVVGGPTHMHGMSRRSTVNPAAREHGLAPGGCVRTWLREAPPGNGRGAAAFDTRFDKPVLVSGSAAHGIARRLEHKGYRLVAPATSFFVDAMEGPLCTGELERARAWGSHLAALFTAA
jgi:hypothetical protein